MFLLTEDSIFTAYGSFHTVLVCHPAFGDAGFFRSCMALLNQNSENISTPRFFIPPGVPFEELVPRPESKGVNVA
jgi:hypothetical protein